MSDEGVGYTLDGQGGQAVAFNIIGLGQEGKNHAYKTDVTGAIQHKGNSASGNEAGTVIAVPLDMRQASRGEKMTNNRPNGSTGGAPGTGIGEDGDPSPSLAASHTPAVAWSERSREGGAALEIEEADVMTTLRQGSQRYQGINVRRLTPTECLRLQAFPDDWLDLSTPLSDSAKYRMIGNAVTTTVAEWIARRITPPSESAPATQAPPTAGGPSESALPPCP